MDQIGIDAPECAICHSTLDPLSYAFANYQGIAGDNTGTFDPTRESRLLGETRQGFLLDQPLGDSSVHGVTEWASVAAQSEQFKRNLVDLFFEHAVDRPLHEDDLNEVRALMDFIEADGYSANRLIGRIVRTPAFGAP